MIRLSFLLTLAFVMCLPVAGRSETPVSNTPLTQEERQRPLQSFSLQHIIEMAHRGHPEAQMKLGYAYANGQGVPRDFQKSHAWSMKAAKQGNAKAQYNVSVDFAHGVAVKKNHDLSLEWLRKSAASGFQLAKDDLAAREKAEQQQDVLPLINRLKERAENDDADAAFGLAAIYAKGQGVPRDMGAAIKWYERAANLGHAHSQFIMASSNFGQISEMEQFDWMLKAAKNGHAVAQYNMAIYYGTIDDTPYDAHEAYAWFKAAQANGQSFSQKSIENMERIVSLFRREADARADEYIRKYVTPFKQ